MKTPRAIVAHLIRRGWPIQIEHEKILARPCAEYAAQRILCGADLDEYETAFVVALLLCRETRLPLEEINRTRSLDRQQRAKKILSLKNEGHLHKNIAFELGCSISTVQRALTAAKNAQT